MVPRPIDVRSDPVLERNHASNVHETRARDEVALVGILPRKPIRDKMAAIVEVRPVDDVVLDQMPTRRLHAADGAAFLRRHGLGADQRERRAATAEPVEGSIGFERGEIALRFGEGGHVAVHFNERVAREFGQLVKGDGLPRGLERRLRFAGAPGQQDTACQQHADKQKLR